MKVHLRRGNLVTILIGLLFIGAGLYAYGRIGRFLDSARETRATVVDIVHESANRKGRRHPVLRFNAADGQEVVVQFEEHHNVQPGDTVQILYDPGNPQHMEIGTLSRARNRRLLFLLLPVGLGVFVCLMGLGVVRLAR